MTFVGEIGLPRHEYLYELRHIDLLLIRRGYERRTRHLWSATRWQTYYIMAAQVGSDGMRKSGINSPTDLIKFPWERETAHVNVSQEDIDEMLALMDSMNAQNTQAPAQQ